MEKHHVVKSGVMWPYSSAPNCKKMVAQLERNEALVSWVVKHGGDVVDQFPAIRVKDNFYTMSLRQMKVMEFLQSLHLSFSDRAVYRQSGGR